MRAASRLVVSGKATLAAWWRVSGAMLRQMTASRKDRLTSSAAMMVAQSRAGRVASWPPGVLQAGQGIVQDALRLVVCEGRPDSLAVPLEQAGVGDGVHQMAAGAGGCFMQADGDVNDDTLFSVDYGKSTAAKDLQAADRILFLPFLASVIHYVVMNCPDCESGRPTFEKWYSQASKRSEWKFREDNRLGDSIRPMNVDMDLTIPEPADTEPETPQEEEDECAESAEKQQADETETVDAEITDEIPEDDTASAPNVTIIEHQTNIAHDESKTFNIKDSSVTFNL